MTVWDDGHIQILSTLFTVGFVTHGYSPSKTWHRRYVIRVEDQRQSIPYTGHGVLDDSRRPFLYGGPEAQTAALTLSRYVSGRDWCVLVGQRSYRLN